MRLVLFLVVTCFAYNTNAFTQTAIIHQSPVKVLQSLLEESDKEIVFKKLVQLKSNINQQRTALMKSESYQPEAFYSAISLRYALAHLPESYNGMPECDVLQRAIEYNERKPIEEFEHPVPLLWQVLSKICKQAEPQEIVE